MRPTAKGGAPECIERNRDLREDRDLRQKDLAESSTAPRYAIPTMKSNKRDIPTPVLVQLAAFYGTSTDYLLGLTDEPTPYPRAREKQDP